MQLKLTLAYDGTGFKGFAKQPRRRTVEGVLREALERLYGSVGPIIVAGRTDSGVHALANVVSVEVDGGPPPDRAAEALNGFLPPDLAVTAGASAPDAFHARFSAISRSYRYRIWRPRERSPLELHRALWHPQRLDLDRLDACATALPGRHDFTAFTPTETQHTVFVRDVFEARWIDRGDLLEFEVTADSFLRRMVRTLVGTMLRCEPDGFASLLEGAPRTAAGPTAPPGGLYLVDVAYPPSSTIDG
jgi:tRNA pseudouridine38-40 synthase